MQPQLNAPEVLSLKDVNALLQHSTEQAFNNAHAVHYSATTSQDISVRYAHFTITAPLINASNTPAEIAKEPHHTSLALDLNKFYLKLSPENVSALQAVSAPAPGSATSSATLITPTTAPDTTTESDLISLSPAHVHFIYRLHLGSENAPEPTGNAHGKANSGERHNNTVTLPTSTTSSYLAQLQRLYINGVRITCTP